MTYRRDYIKYETDKAIELVLDDEVWQAAFDDDDRVLVKNFAIAFIRAYANRSRHPRPVALRVRRMLRAAGASWQSTSVQIAQIESDNIDGDRSAQTVYHHSV